ncbi:MAG: hypothetical protein K2Y25_00725 [Pseudomonadaceae bacterium]|nr:hypothetical protein [Pseudomonadaceae bacterium]
MSEHAEMTPDEFFALSLAFMKRARRFGYAQKSLLALCYAALIAAIFIKLTGGRSTYVTSLGLIGALCGFGSMFVGHIAKPIVAKAQEVAKVVERLLSNTKEEKASSPLPKIPLTIGFANLSGEDLAGFASEDEAVLSSLFIRSKVVPSHQIPSAEILFVYAHLNEDGTIKGQTNSSIRQIVELTNASIIVLASPNSASSIHNAAALPGQKTANIVLTLHRNGNGFSRLFHELFEKMRDGKDMLSAWVEVAPQHPSANPTHAPQTILIAEGGKIAFPR